MFKNILIITFVTVILVAGCAQRRASDSSDPIEMPALPTPASTVEELIINLYSDDMNVRLVSIYELQKYGDAASVAVPALISNLHVDNNDVRVASATTLGKLGQDAQDATQDLLYVLENDPYIHARSAAAFALGRIGNQSSVPHLAAALYDQNPYNSYDVSISSAVAIAKITGEKFSDHDSTTGFQLNANGIPLIVIDARDWWLNEGQYEDLSSK